MTNAYDVVIIGTGAGGGTLARRLAPSGRRILLLERGDWLPREPEDRGAVDIDRYLSPDTWFDGQGSYQPQSHYVVGGATKLYGGALHRLRPDDLRETYHYGGISPAWPIGYGDLEPYYTQVEQLYALHGRHGDDPTEGPASADYPHPPVPHEPRIQRLHDDFVMLGLHPFHAPTGVMVTEAVQARSDAETRGVRPALDFANVTLLTHAEAVRLETTPTGSAVTEVIVDHEGQLERYAADIVVVACGAANSAKLLLASASDAHPSGLGNSSDEVGRNYMGHVLQPVLALSREPNPTVFQKTLAVNDFYRGDGEFHYPMGTIQLMGRSSRPELRREPELRARLAGTFSLKEVTEHAVDFLLSTEDLPRSDNRVTLTREGHIRLRHASGDTTDAQRLYHRLQSMLDRLELHPDYLIHRHAYARVGTYQAGTCRFGSDPSSSVLDINCRVHDVDNLYVVDASFMPSTGAVDPALTVMANAVRVGDHLLERMAARMAVATT